MKNKYINIDSLIKLLTKYFDEIKNVSAHKNPEQYEEIKLISAEIQDFFKNIDNYLAASDNYYIKLYDFYNKKDDIIEKMNKLHKIAGEIKHIKLNTAGSSDDSINTTRYALRVKLKEVIDDMNDDDYDIIDKIEITDINTAFNFVINAGIYNKIVIKTIEKILPLLSGDKRERVRGLIDAEKDKALGVTNCVKHDQIYCAAGYLPMSGWIRNDIAIPAALNIYKTIVDVPPVTHSTNKLTKIENAEPLLAGINPGNIEKYNTINNNITTDIPRIPPGAFVQQSADAWRVMSRPTISAKKSSMFGGWEFDDDTKIGGNEPTQFINSSRMNNYNKILSEKIIRYCFDPKAIHVAKLQDETRNNIKKIDIANYLQKIIVDHINENMGKIKSYDEFVSVVSSAYYPPMDDDKLPVELRLCLLSRFNTILSFFKKELNTSMRKNVNNRIFKEQTDKEIERYIINTIVDRTNEVNELLEKNNVMKFEITLRERYYDL